MGVILDSSVVTKAEREGLTEAELLRSICGLIGDQPIGLSAVGVTELIHGIYRAQTPARTERRRAFVRELVTDLPTYPYTLATAELAGRIDAEQKTAGFVVLFADLLIGATVLSLGFSCLTANVRHFLIPGLDVITL